MKRRENAQKTEGRGKLHSTPEKEENGWPKCAKYASGRLVSFLILLEGGFLETNCRPKTDCAMTKEDSLDDIISIKAGNETILTKRRVLCR